MVAQILTSPGDTAKCGSGSAELWIPIPVKEAKTEFHLKPATLSKSIYCFKKALFL